MLLFVLLDKNFQPERARTKEIRENVNWSRDKYYINVRGVGRLQ